MNSNSDEPHIPAQPNNDAESNPESKLGAALLGIYRPAAQSAPQAASEPEGVTVPQAEVNASGASDDVASHGAQLSPLAVARLLAARYASGNAEQNDVEPHKLEVKVDTTAAPQEQEPGEVKQAASTQAAEESGTVSDPQTEPAPATPETAGQETQAQPEDRAKRMDAPFTGTARPDDAVPPVTEVSLAPEVSLAQQVSPSPEVASAPELLLAAPEFSASKAALPEVKVYIENLEPESVTDAQTVDTLAVDAPQDEFVEADLAHPVLPEPDLAEPDQPEPEVPVPGLPVTPEPSPAPAPESAAHPVSNGRDAEPLAPESVPLPSEPPVAVPLPASALRDTSGEGSAAPDLRARTLAAIRPAAVGTSPAPSVEAPRAQVVPLPSLEAAVPENIQPISPAPSTPATSAPVPLPSVPEVDPTAQMLGNVWRARWPILGAALLTGVLAYGLSSMQKPNYVATASLASTLPSANDVVGASVVTAPVLASGAMNQALQGPELTRTLIERVSKLTVADDVKQAMLGSLQRHLDGQGSSPVWVEGFEGDKVNNGLYQVSGRASNAAAAQTLANTAAEVVLSWDVQRAREQLKRARTSIQGQLRALEQDTPNNDLYDSAHEAARSRLLQNLAVTGAAQESAVGTLQMVSQAMQPAQPLSPKPLRQALLSGLLALLVAAGLAGFLGGRSRPS